MSAGLKAKRWGMRAAVTALILAVLWGLASSPWTTYGLWYDAVKHEALFRQAAVEAHPTVDPTQSEQALARLGYTRIESDHGVMLFYKYQRFMGKGILGIAYAPDGVPSEVSAWAHLYDVPPHWSWKRMPHGFYIFAGQ